MFRESENIAVYVIIIFSCGSLKFSKGAKVSIQKHVANKPRSDSITVKSQNAMVWSYTYAAV